MRAGLILAACLCLAGPAAAQSQAEMNDAVRAMMAREGDDGRRARHVVHYAYPDPNGTPASRKSVIAYLKENGFGAVPTRFDGVAFDHRASIAPGRFDGLTDALDANLARLGWLYDGWEAELLK